MSAGTLFNPKFTVVNGIKLAYTEAGSTKKDVLLFIHGLAENMRSWSKNIDGLKDSFKCISLDLPGHGLSDIGNYQYTPYFFSETIIAFIKNIGLEKVNLVGHSLGGQIAIITALAHPSFADSLVLIAPAGFETFSEKDKRWILHHSKNYTSPLQGFDFLSLWSNQSVPPDAVYKATVSGMMHHPVFEYLHLVHQPSLVIFGEEDPFIPNRFLHPLMSPVSVAESGTHQMPNARLVMVHNAGHFVHIERSGEVDNEIITFLRNI